MLKVMYDAAKVNRLSQSVLVMKRCFAGSEFYDSSKNISKAGFSEEDVNELNHELGTDGVKGGLNLPGTMGSNAAPRAEKGKSKAQSSANIPRTQRTNYSIEPATAYEGLTHVDNNGKPHMVNVSSKAITTRTAHARARLDFPNKVFDHILSTFPSKPGTSHDVPSGTDCSKDFRVFKPNPESGIPGTFLPQVCISGLLRALALTP